VDRCDDACRDLDVVDRHNDAGLDPDVVERRDDVGSRVQGGVHVPAVGVAAEGGSTIRAAGHSSGGEALGVGGPISGVVVEVFGPGADRAILRSDHIGYDAVGGAVPGHPIGGATADRSVIPGVGPEAYRSSPRRRPTR
jgi:hypothetical protein